MIAILSIEQGEGHGAEIVLENLLRGWGATSPQLVVCAPENSRVIRCARELDYRHHVMSATRDSVVPNFRGLVGLRPHLEGADVVHAWTARVFEGSVALARRLSRPATGTLHDHPRAPFHGRSRQWLMRRSSARFARLACVSQAVRDACEKNHYTCSMDVLHNGLVELPPAEREADSTVHIGFLGMYVAWKGFSVVEQWIRDLKDADVVWHLYGALCPELSESAGRLVDALPGKVILEGNRNAESIFSSIDVLIHASVEFDPLPTVLIEAARAGLPVVASRLGGSHEIVLSEETGFLFKPSSPESGLQGLRALIEDQSLRSRMGRAARQQFDQFTVQSMVHRYHRFWQRVLDSAGADRGSY